MDQWIEKDPSYINCHFHWGSTEEEEWKSCAAMELNCEERSVTQIKKYNLPIDLEAYYQKGNVYLASYFYFWKLHCFYDPNHVPYEDEHLLAEFPKDRFLTMEEIWRPRTTLWAFYDKYGKPL